MEQGQDRASGERKDWVGRQFGDLTVLSYDGRRGGKHFWRCRCRCGREALVCQSNLKSGHTRSCGCRVSPEKTRHFVEGTCIEAIKSKKVWSNNTSGVRGVYRNKRTGRWIAQITFQGRTRYLGSYPDLSAATEARALAEETFSRFLEEYDKMLEMPGNQMAAYDEYAAGPEIVRDMGVATINIGGK